VRHLTGSPDVDSWYLLSGLGSIVVHGREEQREKPTGKSRAISVPVDFPADPARALCFSLFLFWSRDRRCDVSLTPDI